MKTDEKDLLDRIDRALEHEFVNETGIVIIKVENGYIRLIGLGLANGEEDD